MFFLSDDVSVKPKSKDCNDILLDRRELGSAAKRAPVHACEMLKISLTNHMVPDQFTIIKTETEMDKNPMETGCTPEFVVSGKVKNLGLRMAIKHLFDRVT